MPPQGLSALTVEGIYDNQARECVPGLELADVVVSDFREMSAKKYFGFLESAAVFFQLRKQVFELYDDISGSPGFDIGVKSQELVGERIINLPAVNEDCL